MKSRVRQLIQEACGQNLVEYGLLIALVTIGTINAVNAIGCKVGVYFSNLNNALP
jgi:Flp pilus assembly pilin Flp